MPQSPPLIAVFNDDQVFLGLMEELLAEEGYAAHSGLVDGEALQFVRDNKPALVILDFALGNPQSAWTILELVRLDPTTASTPIVICSANTPLLRENADRLQELNCTIIRKPFLVDELFEHVKKRLEEL